MPTCWIIAGPNGAGKTTFALDYLPDQANCPHFINADLIAAGLSPFAPEKELIAASRILLSEIDLHIKKRNDFAFETTLAGKSYLALIERLKSDGWHVVLVYLALPNMEMSRQRVAERVAHGGHHVPAKDIERRFPRSLYNLLTRFSMIVDHCLCFMNDGESPILIFEQQGEQRDIINERYYDMILKEAGL